MHIREHVGLLKAVVDREADQAAELAATHIHMAQLRGVGPRRSLSPLRRVGVDCLSCALVNR